MQDRRGASFVDGCETAVVGGRAGRSHHFWVGKGAVSLLKASAAVRMGMPWYSPRDEQMPLVSGDDELSFGGERAGEDVILIGVAVMRGTSAGSGSSTSSM